MDMNASLRRAARGRHGGTIEAQERPAAAKMGELIRAAAGRQSALPEAPEPPKATSFDGGAARDALAYRDQSETSMNAVLAAAMGRSTGMPLTDAERALVEEASLGD